MIKLIQELPIFVFKLKEKNQVKHKNSKQNFAHPELYKNSHVLICYDVYRYILQPV